MSNRAIGFVLVGVFAGCVNLAARALLNQFMSYELAVFLAYSIGLTCAFVMNRSYVFNVTSGAPLQQYLKFALVNLLALAQVWLISVLFMRLIFPSIGFYWNSALISHAIGVASPILTSFFAYKYFVFREPSKKLDELE
jgi:putative flippase GtrA